MSNVISFDPPKKPEPICSFCKKPKSKVPVLIHEEGRPGICSVCLAKCNALLDQASQPKA